MTLFSTLKAILQHFTLQKESPLKSNLNIWRLLKTPFKILGSGLNEGLTVGMNVTSLHINHFLCSFEKGITFIILFQEERELRAARPQGFRWRREFCGSVTRDVGWL